MGLVGMGGSGKSTLARALAADPAVRAHFADVVWLDAGRAADPLDCQARLCVALGDPAPVADLDTGLDRLRALVKDAPHLIVLDDVWDPALLAAFELDDPTSALLVTTRDRDVVARPAVACPVGLLDDDLARRMLAAWSDRLVAELPAEAADIVDSCGGLALALAAAGGMVADGWSWAAVVDRLRRVDLARLNAEFPDYPQPNLLAAFEVSVAALDADLRERYLRLAVFEGRGPVPVGAAALVWAAGGDVEDVVVSLARRSLLRFDPESRLFTLHDLQFAYVRQVAGADRSADLHAALARGFLDRWGGLDLALPSTASVDFGTDPTDRYGLAHLVDHLVRGGAADTVHTLLGLEGSLFTAAGRAPERGNLWFGVQDRVGETAAYLRDVDVAWRLAEAATDEAEAGRGTAAIGLEARYALMHGSAASIAFNLPPDLLPELVAHGVWTPDQALAYARAGSSRSERPRALACLLPRLPEQMRAPVALEAATTAVSTGVIDAPHVLREVWEHVNPAERRRLLGEAVAAVRAEEDSHGCFALTRLAELAPADERAQLLHEAVAISRGPSLTGEPDPFPQAFALTALASHQSGPERDRTLDAAASAAGAVDDPGQRCSSLARVAALLAGRPRERMLAQALRAARKVKRASRVESLAEVARELPEGERDRLVKEAFALAVENTETEWVADLSYLAPLLPDRLLPAALAAARTVSGAPARYDVLLKLADRLPAPQRGPVLDDALAAARAGRDGRDRAHYVTEVARQLPPDRRPAVIAEALRAARSVGGGELAPAYASLARHLPAPRGGEMFDHAVALAHAIAPDGRRSTSQAVARHAPPGRAEELFAEVLDLVEADPSPLIALRWVTADLPPGLAYRAIGIASRYKPGRFRLKEHDDVWALALAGVAEHLPANLAERAAYCLLFTLYRDFALEAMRRLAPHLSGMALANLLDASYRALNGRLYVQVGAILAPYLAEAVRPDAIDLRYRIARRVDDPERRCEMLTLLAPNLPAASRRTALDDALASAARIDKATDRAEALTAVARLLPGAPGAEAFADALAAAAAADRYPGPSAAMGKVARAASETVEPPWSHFWRPVLRRAAVEGRTNVADQIAAAAPDIARLGEPGAVEAVVGALDDVARWWP